MWSARPWSPHVTVGRLDDSWWRSARSFSFSGNALLLSPATLCVCVCICRLDTFYYRLNICCSLQDGSCQRSRERQTFLSCLWDGRWSFNPLTFSTQLSPQGAWKSNCLLLKLQTQAEICRCHQNVADVFAGTVSCYLIDWQRLHRRECRGDEMWAHSGRLKGFVCSLLCVFLFLINI